jgi:hypothetical protein
MDTASRNPSIYLEPSRDKIAEGHLKTLAVNMVYTLCPAPFTPGLSQQWNAPKGSGPLPDIDWNGSRWNTSLAIHDGPKTRAPSRHTS